jgi:hypothetical protein
MVYYFSSNTTSPAAFIYVGKDKVESAVNSYEKSWILKVDQRNRRRAYQTWLGRRRVVPCGQPEFGAYLCATAGWRGLGADDQGIDG